MTLTMDPERLACGTPVDLPPTVESAVLRRIRAIGRNGHPLELPGAGRGRTTVHSAVIAEVARLAAEQVPGVSRVVVDVGEDLSLSASLAARYGLAFHALADQVRAAIAVELELHLAMRPGRIDVVVTDLC